MDGQALNRSYLETLSTADLLSLSDKYDIDIPPELNRCFIIGELLDAAIELNAAHKNEMVIVPDNTDDKTESHLPESYNETYIDAVLRNPACAYVYWDIGENDKDVSHLALNVLFYDSLSDEKYSDYFDIQISDGAKERYVLLPHGKNVFSVDIAGVVHGKFDLLASSRKIEIPHGIELLSSTYPGKKIDMLPILRLSGMEQLLSDHYTSHRQAF